MTRGTARRFIASIGLLPGLFAVSALTGTGVANASATSGNTPGTAPGPVGVVQTCAFTNTFCAWDAVGFQGNPFNVKALDPTVGACVDLVDHGWGGGRIRSAINTNTRSATLYTNADCTGASQTIVGNSSDSDVTIASNSVFVF